MIWVPGIPAACPAAMASDGSRLKSSISGEVFPPVREQHRADVPARIPFDWSNLYGGKLADRGRGVEPLTHIRPIYCAHAVLMASLVVAHWVPVYGALLLVVLGMFMYLQNSASQVLYMDVASQSHPGSLNLAASLNSMSFNIGIAIGSAIGGLINGHFGLMWLGPVGALFLVCAIAITTFLRPFVAQERDFYADI